MGLKINDEVDVVSIDPTGRVSVSVEELLKDKTFKAKVKEKAFLLISHKVAEAYSKEMLKPMLKDLQQSATLRKSIEALVQQQVQGTVGQIMYNLFERSYYDS